MNRARSDLTALPHLFQPRLQQHHSKGITNRRPSTPTVTNSARIQRWPHSILIKSHWAPAADLIINKSIKSVLPLAANRRPPTRLNGAIKKQNKCQPMATQLGFRWRFQLTCLTSFLLNPPPPPRPALFLSFQILRILQIADRDSTGWRLENIFCPGIK